MSSCGAGRTGGNTDDRPSQQARTAPLGHERVRGAGAARTRGGRKGRPPARRLPAAPLLRQVELRGGVTALGSRRRDADLALIERAARDGSITIWMADHLAVTLLGLTLWDLWPEID